MAVCQVTNICNLVTLHRLTFTVRHSYRGSLAAFLLTSAGAKMKIKTAGLSLSVLPGCRFHSSAARPSHQAKHLEESFQLLDLQEDCNLADAKEAYLKLAKHYHPDGQAKTANAHKFSEVKEAYQTVRLHLEKQESSQQEEADETEEAFDFKHTAPQHRQYLDYEGVGTGTPIQREKQYQKFRAFRASNFALDHKVEKLARKDSNALVFKDKKAARKIKTTNTIDRMVEDLIQQSMANGDFDNLPGSGKPLPSRTNYCPYIDISQHNLNQVLVNNGYIPEWIRLDREIKSALQDLKSNLLKERLKLGPEPLNAFNVNKWTNLVDAFEADVAKLNKQINHLNLIVPIMKLQMVHFKADRELDKVVREYNDVKPLENESKMSSAEGAGHGRLYQLFEKLSEKIINRIIPP